MAGVSRRAARSPSRGGLANITFLATGVEQLPAQLDGIADLVTVRLPWGSLLRGALGLDASAAEAIARLVAPGGRLELILSLVERDAVLGAGRNASGSAGADRVFGPSHLATIEATFDRLGLHLEEAMPLSAEEVRATGSSWARRLRAGHDRQAWRVTLGRR